MTAILVILALRVAMLVLPKRQRERLGKAMGVALSVGLLWGIYIWLVAAGVIV